MKFIIILLASCGLCFGQKYMPFYLPAASASSSSNNWATAFNVGSGGGLRNDGPFVVGAQITIGATNVTVFALGRTNAAASTLNHPMAIFNSGGVIVVSNTIPPMASIGQQWITVPDTVLTAGATYYIGSFENGNSDSWLDHMTATVSPSATLVTSTFASFPPFSAPTGAVTANTIYVGLTFAYR